jgi:FlaA1/EpsC-like NDP-sugar epimerase
MAWHFLIIGSGSQARYVIDIVKARGNLDIVGIADIESKKRVGQVINGVKVVCVVDEVSRLYSPQYCRILIAYGDGRRKK